MLEPYILYAILAYVLLAFHGVADKFMLTNTIKHPIVYTFFAGSSSIFVFVLAPFGLKFLSWDYFWLAFISGVLFLYATYFLYKAIQGTSVSRVLPMEGGLVPFFTYIFAHFFLGEVLTTSQTLAIILLASGAILLSLRNEKGGWRFGSLMDATIAAIFFAGSFVMIKSVYDYGGLVSGLVWSRLGLFSAALLFLAFPKYRNLILTAPRESGVGNAVLFYCVRFIGAIAGVLQNYAIAIGSVVIVNALQGLQFVFILALTSFISLYYPNILKEKLTTQILAAKVCAIVLITFGLALLSK